LCFVKALALHWGRGLNGENFKGCISRAGSVFVSPTPLCSMETGKKREQEVGMEEDLLPPHPSQKPLAALLPGPPFNC